MYLPRIQRKSGLNVELSLPWLVAKLVRLRLLRQRFSVRLSPGVCSFGSSGCTFQFV